MKKILSEEEFGIALFDLETDYKGISQFYYSDRRTGHRWLMEGPSNQVARFIQLCLALGITVGQARDIIAAGQAKSGIALPKQVVELSTQVAALQQELRQKAKAARGGAKGASSGHRSKRRAPKKGRGAEATA